jgi:predicted phage terminase large subunit-like protein
VSAAPCTRLSVKLPPLHPSQRLVADSTARLRILVTGRQWGKTRLAAWMAVRAMLHERAACWWVAPTYQASEIGWRLVRKLAGAIVRAAPDALDVRLGDRGIVSRAGGELWFKSAERPDNLRGGTLDFVTVDEADYCEEYLWSDVLSPMLGVRKGQALLVSSPRLEGSWFHRLWQEGQGADPDVASWQFPTWDSPYWDAKEVERARRDLPAISFRREYGAEFVSAAGALVRREYLRVGSPAAALPCVLAVDLAISEKEGADYTALAVMSRDADGRIYLLHVERLRTGFHGAIERIKALAATWGPTVIAVEAVQYQAAAVQELLRRTMLPVRGVKPDRDKVTRFQPLAARYEQGLVYHAPDLPREFEQELLAFPVGKHDDMVDAASYAFAALSSMGAGRVAVAGERVRLPSFA